MQIRCTVVVVTWELMGHAQGAYNELDKKAREKFRLEEEAVRWFAHDHDSGDLVPYIGPYHLDSRRRYTATGFKAWSVTHARIAARIITNQISDRKNPWAELCSPRRTSEALKSVAQQTKSALEHLVKFGKRCTHMGCLFKKGR